MSLAQISSTPKTLLDWVNPTERQREFLKALERHRFVLFGGAAGPGKSYILRWWLVLFLAEAFHALGLRNVHVALFCEDYPSLHDRQISKIEVEFPSWLGRLRQAETKEFVLNEEYGSGVLALRNLDKPSKYLSAEFAAIGVDELTRNQQSVFDFLRLRLRWPGIPRTLFAGATNPGGIGHAWVKNYWLDRKFPPELQTLANEFHFVKALPTDNPHLSRQYWSDLATLPEHMQKAYLRSDWNLLAGQYFPQELPIVNGVRLERWWPKWLSGDWGYAHPFSIHWHTRKEDGRILTYRELYGKEIGEAELGERIRSLTPQDEKISSFYLSPDAFAKRGSANTVAEQIGDVLRPAGLPIPEPADNDRVGGARLMHQLISSGQWEIDGACTKLIECLPTLIRDEDSLEDVLKVDATETTIGDDPYDSARYGLKSYLAQKGPPMGVRIERKVEAAQFTDPTSEMIFRSKWEKQELRKAQPAHFGRRWRR